MKKLILFVFILTGLSGISQKTPFEIIEFINSEDFAWFKENSQFASNGTVDLESSFVEYEVRDNQKIPVISVNFASSVNDFDKIIVGQIQAIKVRQDFTGLPRNARYLQLYRDFRDFNFRTETGIINVHDLNYGEYQATKATIVKGEVTQLSSYQMPPEIAERFGTGIPSSPGYHQCDLNQNGNVTFGECFNCLVASCAANPVCSVFCQLANLVVKNVCMASTIANCLIISIIY
jgi:hypothetical protein